MNLLRLAWRNMNLSYHDAWSWWGEEWKGCYKLSDRTACSYDWRLLNTHGNHEFFLVDYKLWYNRQRQAEQSNYILSHGICYFELQPAWNQVIDLHFSIDLWIYVLDSINYGHFVKFLSINWHLFIQSLDSLKNFLRRYFIGLYIDMHVAHFVLSSPLIVDFGKIVNVFV